MKTENADNLERDLAELTRWPGEDVQAWRAALAAEGRRIQFGATALRGKLLSGRLSARAAVGLAAALLLLLIVPVLHSIGTSVTAPWRWSMTAPGFTVESPREVLTEARRGEEPTRLRAKLSSLGYGGRAGPSEATIPEHRYEGVFDGGNLEGTTSGRFVTALSTARSGEQPATVGDRQVIRKATIELRATDVRAVFLKATHLISEAQGEYVQESSLTGAENRVEGNLTLRVAAERLSAVLQQLRELGAVRAETSGGEDVTTQVVDLEARLSNERRVEAELLQLMEKRADAPLKDVLELRTAIGNVRQSIETMTAQRERLSRLVWLATVLVIIRPADAAEPTPPGLWDYFTTAVSRAAQRGVQALINTVAGLILVLIGGALWIILLAIAVVMLMRRLRRQNRGTV